MFSNFDTWGESAFWPAVASAFGASKVVSGAKTQASLDVETSSGLRPATLGLQLSEALVVENKVLTADGVPVKRMVRFKLPTETSYQCGDYLAVLPVNPANVVHKAMRRFGLPWDATLRIQKSSESSSTYMLPLDVPVGAFDLLSSYVELSQPASKRDINTLAELAATDEETQAELKYLASSPSRFTEEVVKKRLSPLDLLIKYPHINISIGEYLAMLPPMRVRQYSISSSPLADPTECTVTLSVLNAPLLSAGQDDKGSEEAFFHGVASTYLASLRPGDRAHVSVRPSNTGFRPPVDLKTPMIMACAGSGLAPFRGFMMERAEKIRGRRASIFDGEAKNVEEPAKAILYVGCRTKGKDDIHAEELEEWERLGAVKVRWAYSRPDADDGTVAQHIHDCMQADKEELIELFNQGARIYVCGSTGVGNAVKSTVRDIYLEERKKKIAAGTLADTDAPADADDETASTQFFEKMRTKQRYVTDVFA
jgi:cytochrome P450 / NADPH-cytochrome P450 reductase